MLLNLTKQDKLCKFLRKSSFFHAIYNRKTEKQTIHLAYVSLMPFSFPQNPSIKLTYTKWTDCFFSVFVLYEAWKKRTSLKICTFCPVLSHWKVFSLTSCAFWMTNELGKKQERITQKAHNIDAGAHSTSPPPFFFFLLMTFIYPFTIVFIPPDFSTVCRKCWMLIKVYMWTNASF